MRTALSQRAVVVASVYAVLALVWIVFSDQFLVFLVHDTVWLTLLQTVKGWFFVGVTATLLYFTLRHSERTEPEPTTPPRPFRGSLRGRVVALVVLTTVPLVVLTIYNGLEQQRNDRAQAREQVLRLARQAVLRQERVLDSIREMLFTLTKLPAVHQTDAAACNQLFTELLPLSGRPARIGATTPAGTLFAAAPAPVDYENFATRPWFQQVLAQRDYTVFHGQELVCAQPVYDTAQELKAVVFAQVDRQWLAQFAGESHLPEGAVVTVVNRAGRITGRTAAAAQWIGQRTPLAADLTGQTSVVLEGPDIDGVKRIQACLPTGKDWIIVGLPSTLVTMDSSQELIRNLFSIILVACAAIGAASGMAELSIFRHLRELTAATRRLSAGNLTTRARLQDAPSEWRELAKEFDAMAASLEQRTRERDHVEQMLRAAEARLTAAIESLPFDFWLADLEARVVMQNATSLRRWGKLIGNRPAESGLPVDVVRTWQRNHRRALAGEIVSREVRDDTTGRHYQNIIAPVLMDGRPTGVLGVSIDTTDHRRAEETLRALTRRLRAVREEESTRIARAVHDDLGQAMTALKFDLAWCRQQTTSPAVTDKLATMMHTVDAALQTVRRIAAELRPGVLDNLGLVAAIEWQSQDFQRRTGITCHTNLPEAPLNLEPTRATAVFRIFQEALTNVARHAQASEVGVALVHANHHVILEVADNGIGLRTDPWQDAHSLGLLGMRERARSLQGDVTVNPGPIHGTVVCVSLPTKESPHHREFAL